MSNLRPQAKTAAHDGAKADQPGAEKEERGRLRSGSRGVHYKMAW